jgi:hypothetical protein
LGKEHVGGDHFAPRYDNWRMKNLEFSGVGRALHQAYRGSQLLTSCARMSYVLHRAEGSHKNRAKLLNIAPEIAHEDQ